MIYMWLYLIPVIIFYVGFAYERLTYDCSNYVEPSAIFGCCMLALVPLLNWVMIGFICAEIYKYLYHKIKKGL